MVSSRRLLIVFAAILASGMWPTPPVNGQTNQPRRQSPADRQRSLLPREIAAKISKSLVLIVTQDKEGEPIASGSGFFYNIKNSK